MGLGSRIQGLKKALDPGSGYATLITVITFTVFYVPVSWIKSGFDPDSHHQQSFTSFFKFHDLDPDADPLA
jgi:hypothetical protein